MSMQKGTQSFPCRFQITREDFASYRTDFAVFPVDFKSFPEDITSFPEDIRSIPCLRHFFLVCKAPSPVILRIAPYLHRSVR